MAGAAPTEVLQHVSKLTSDLQHTVANGSTQAGHPVTAKEVNPDDRSSLENIRQTVESMTRDPVRIVGGIVEEKTGGESYTTHVGTTGGKEPISIAARRGLQKTTELLRKAA